MWEPCNVIHVSFQMMPKLDVDNTCKHIDQVFIVILIVHVYFFLA